ncbi:hypothetical protein NBO_4g0055 [Nosema bombycis CQ1]|uniref:Uncharacterized protein n=1 Tax=Nosema bombycis (strain CQ1 / CVCC 102059) TaxID=578461 RepID=R0KZ21_NOSB1|nr:hypothetical protein NBO_4g0055 [Nosema bombycis CQ1]|eukprot:EOB15427.1 hypothetical protein NBO_4g0055 [Nosema bombycis CQ1]
MGKKQTRARSYVDVYLKETGLINTIGSKRWNEFLDDVYMSFKKSKMVKSKSEGDLCVVRDTEIEGKLVYNKELCGDVVDGRVGDSRVVDSRVGDSKEYDRGVNEDIMVKNGDRKESRDDIPISNPHISNPPINIPIHNIPPPCSPDYNESYYNNGYLQSVGHPFVQLKHPPLENPHLENPHLFKPKIKREEIELRIQAVFGLLKLRRVKKNK